MVPEIQNETDRIFCHFGPEILFFYTYMCTINEDHIKHGS